MPMVWHDAKRHQSHRHLQTSLFEHPLKRRIVTLFLEQLVTTDGAVKGMIEIVASGKAWASWHRVKRDRESFQSMFKSAQHPSPREPASPLQIAKKRLPPPLFS